MPSLWTQANKRLELTAAAAAQSQVVILRGVWLRYKLSKG